MDSFGDGVTEMRFQIIENFNQAIVEFSSSKFAQMGLTLDGCMFYRKPLSVVSCHSAGPR